MKPENFKKNGALNVVVEDNGIVILSVSCIQEGSNEMM